MVGQRTLNPFILVRIQVRQLWFLPQDDIIIRDMWWKIYFWFNMVAIIIDLLMFSQHGILEVLSSVNFYIGTFAVYLFIYKKILLTYIFWRIFFFCSLLFDFLFSLYRLLPIKSLTFLSHIHTSTPMNFVVIGLVVMNCLYIPMLYATYRLSQNKFLKN